MGLDDEGGRRLDSSPREKLAWEAEEGDEE